MIPALDSAETEAFKNMKDNKPYDDKGNAKHYTKSRISTLIKIEQVWGTLGAMLFCEMNAFKYRDRIGEKDDPSLELKKIQWYDKAAEIMRKKAFSGQGVSGLDDMVNHHFNL